MVHPNACYKLFIETIKKHNTEIVLRFYVTVFMTLTVPILNILYVA